MNAIANATQYPIRCTQCHRMTALPAATILENKEVVCRHCQHVTSLDKKIIQSIEKTLSNMSDYVEKREPITFQDSTDDTSDTTDSTGSSILSEAHNQTATPSLIPETPHQSPQQQISSQPHSIQTHSTQNNRRTPSRRNRKSKRKNQQPALADG